MLNSWNTTRNSSYIGSQNAITYKEIFPWIREGRLWLGYGFKRNCAHFISNYTDHATDLDKKEGMIRVPGVFWFTNLDHDRRHENLVLYRRYTPDDYPKYDNYDAINVDKTAEIPADYGGVMGVPLTFLDKHNPDQFEILGTTQSWFDARTRHYPRQIQVGANGKRSSVTKLNDGAAIKVSSAPIGKTHYIVGNDCYIKVYARLLIRNRNPENPA